MDFQRSPKSAAEIAALAALGTTQCEAQVRAHGKGYDPETLVHLLRRSLGEHNTPLFELCGRLLVGREEPRGCWQGGHCEGVIVNLASDFGFTRNRDVMRQFREQCHSALWIAVHAGWDKKPFWEIRFGLAFRQRCIDVARWLIRQQSKALDRRALEAVGSDRDPDIDGLADPDMVAIDEDVLGRLSSPQHQKVLLAAVRRLPKRQSHAVLLAWLQGKHIEGRAPNTVALLMGITPREVYYLLAQARETLKSDPAIRAIWFGEA